MKESEGMMAQWVRNLYSGKKWAVTEPMRYTSIPEAIYKLRTFTGMTYDDLAMHTSTTPANIKRMEHAPPTAKGAPKAILLALAAVSKQCSLFVLQDYFTVQSNMDIRRRLRKESGLYRN